MDVHLIITFTAKPEKRLALGALLERVQEQLPRMRGCKAVRAFNSAGDPCVFTLLETWESEEHHKEFIDRMLRTGAWDRIASHLAAEPVSAYYRAL
jgi:quinol monooxygenase YgiN